MQKIVFLMTRLILSCMYIFFRYSKGVASPERFVRTRLYFTSESHIHSLLNMFRYGGLFDVSVVVSTFLSTSGLETRSLGLNTLGTT